MLICKGDTAYKCSKLETFSIGKMHCIQFSITEPISQNDVVNIFEDNTFYFYDDVLKGEMIETNHKKLVGLSITYNEDLTCKITIKLINGDGFNEN